MVFGYGAVFLNVSSHNIYRREGEILSSEKITVDEPLISTDVDKLIRTVADRRKVSLAELRELCKIDKKTLDKWITVLEDTGYITVKYALGNTFIIWSGSADVAAPTNLTSTTTQTTPPSAEITTVDSDTVVDSSTMATTPDSELLELIKEDVKEDAQNVQKKEIQDAPLLSEAIETEIHTTGTDEETAIDSLKYGILTKLKESEDEDTKNELMLEAAKDNEAAKDQTKPEATFVIMTDETKMVAEEKKTHEMKTEETVIEENVAEQTADEETAAEEPGVEDSKPAPVAISASESGVRNPESETQLETNSSVPLASEDTKKSINEYIEAIKEEKANLAKLEAEKGRIYAERIATIEGKMDSDIGALTQTILEKEQKLLDLKDGFLEMPDKIEDIEKIQAQLERIRSEGKVSLEVTRKKSEQLLGQINDTRADVRGKIDRLDSLIRDEDSKIGQLERLDASLQAKVEKLTSAIADAKVQMDDLNSVMSELSDDLNQTRNMKAKVKDISGELKETVAEQGSELHSLEKELSGISNVERLVNDYLSQYEKKLEDIEAYVAKSDDEIAGLRASAESTYLKRYLSELESTADAYEGELEGALSDEQDIEAKIVETKTKISAMIRQSRTLIKRLHGESSAVDYETARASARARSAKLRESIAEKASQRVKILEESKATRKTKIAPASANVFRSTASVPNGSTPVSKSSSKKRKKKGE